MYSYLKSIWKGIKYPVFTFLGYVVVGFISKEPEIASQTVYGGLTVGGLLIFLFDWLKHKAQLKIIQKI